MRLKLTSVQLSRKLKNPVDQQLTSGYFEYRTGDVRVSHQKNSCMAYISGRPDSLSREVCADPGTNVLDIHSGQGIPEISIDKTRTDCVDTDRCKFQRE